MTPDTQMWNKRINKTQKWNKETWNNRKDTYNRHEDKQAAMFVVVWFGSSGGGPVGFQESRNLSINKCFMSLFHLSDVPSSPFRLLCISDLLCSCFHPLCLFVCCAFLQATGLQGENGHTSESKIP